MKQHIFPLVMVITLACSYIGCWWSGYYSGVKHEQKRAFNAGCAHYKVQGAKTEFVYGEAK